MTRPSVTTLIPAYNVGPLLARAIDSALDQADAAGRPIAQQVIVVDDGSSDATAAVAEGFGPRITLIRQSHAGVAAARNAGLRAARGDVVAFLDADDQWLRGKLDAQLALFEREPTLVLVACDAEFVDRQDRVELASFLASRRCHGQLPREPGRIDRAATLLALEPLLTTSGVVARRGAIGAAGEFDPTLVLCEDRDLWLRLACRGPVGIVPRVGVRYFSGRTGSLFTEATTRQWVGAIRRLLMKNRRALAGAFAAEGEHPRDVFSRAFVRLAMQGLRAGQVDVAAGCLVDALRLGSLPWILRQSWTALGRAVSRA